MFSFLSRFYRRFRSEESGSMSVEAVFAFPMLLWAATGTYTFFDAYKAQNATYRANYTVSDMLSRETAAINANYIAGLYKVYRFMTTAPEDSWIRVSQLVCVSDCADEEARVLEFDWSHGVNGARSLTDADFDFYADKVPLLAQSDRLILVETSTNYVPPFTNLLLSMFPERRMESHVVTRPRFAPQLIWDPAYDTSDGGHDDGSDTDDGAVDSGEDV